MILYHSAKLKYSILKRNSKEIFQQNMNMYEIMSGMYKMLDVKNSPARNALSVKCKIREIFHRNIIL